MTRRVRGEGIKDMSNRYARQAYQDSSRYRVGEYVKTSRGLVRVDKVNDDNSYTVTLDKVIQYQGKFTNVFRAEVVPRLVITGLESFDD